MHRDDAIGTKRMFSQIVMKIKGVAGMGFAPDDDNEDECKFIIYLENEPTPEILSQLKEVLGEIPFDTMVTGKFETLS